MRGIRRGESEAGDIERGESGEGGRGPVKSGSEGKTGLGKIIQDKTLKYIPNRKYEKYLKEKKESDVGRIC